MAYQALYRKWRPRTFDGVVGQTAITDTLKNAIKRGKISHAFCLRDHVVLVKHHVRKFLPRP
ncbi:hypothetical protein LBGG_02083 [Lactobacillus gasseri MV-22]|nr:hypothetical protein LBGG_02083 [Lactobacillus gasseri MV-22]